MKIDVPSTTQFAALVRKVLLITITLVLFSADAQARKDENLIARIQCCLSEENNCQGGCCGIVFCRKACLHMCFTNEEICEDDCEIRLGPDPDGAFFDTVTLKRGGRVLRVAGPFRCPAGAKAEVSVTITQSTGALARGDTHVRCLADETTFTVKAKAIERNDFRPLSTATACGVARVSVGDQGLDAFHWCRDVTVLPVGVELED